MISAKRGDAESAEESAELDGAGFLQFLSETLRALRGSAFRSYLPEVDAVGSGMQVSAHERGGELQGWQ